MAWAPPSSRSSRSFAAKGGDGPAERPPDRPAERRRESPLAAALVGGAADLVPEPGSPPHRLFHGARRAGGDRPGRRARRTGRGWSRGPGTRRAMASEAGRRGRDASRALRRTVFGAPSTTQAAGRVRSGSRRARRSGSVSFLGAPVFGSRRPAVLDRNPGHPEYGRRPGSSPARDGDAGSCSRQASRLTPLAGPGT